MQLILMVIILVIIVIVIVVVLTVVIIIIATINLLPFILNPVVFVLAKKYGKLEAAVHWFNYACLKKFITGNFCYEIHGVHKLLGQNKRRDRMKKVEQFL